MSRNIFIVSGPSGCGKSTLISMLRKDFPEIEFSVSSTTRKIRSTEEHGKDYYFLDEKDFRERIDKGFFAEWAKVYNNYYGTSWDEINTKSEGKRVILLDIDVQGAFNIKQKYPEAVLVFIVPPSLSELKSRLVNRENRVDDEIICRLNEAKLELQKFEVYDYVVVNDILQKAYKEFYSVYKAFTCRVDMNHQVFYKLLKG